MSPMRPGASNHDDLRFASPTEGSVKGSLCERERILCSTITQRKHCGFCATIVYTFWVRPREFIESPIVLLRIASVGQASPCRLAFPSSFFCGHLSFELTWIEEPLGHGEARECDSRSRVGTVRGVYGA